MSNKLSFILCALFTMLNGEKLEQEVHYNLEGSLECSRYLSKFSSESDVSKIAYFSGDSTFIGNTSDIQVKIRYSDDEYFNDPIYWGLVKEDGKTPETTCLELKLLKLEEYYQDGVQVTDLIITPSNNTQKLWRYYSFTIKASEFAQKLNQTANSNNYVYVAHYGLSFYTTGTDQLLYTFYFELAVIVSKTTGAAIETFFRSLLQEAPNICTPASACQIVSPSKLNWCYDFNCTKYIEKPDLHLNDQFVLQQIVTTSGMTGFYLTDTKVWYIGNGLYKKATIIQIDNSVAGSVKITLNAEITWRSVTIKVDSVLSNTVNGTRRLLTQTTFNTVAGSTDEITCIKAENSDTCATCEQECYINGFSSDGCDFCDSSIVIYTFITLSLVFFL